MHNPKELRRMAATARAHGDEEVATMLDGYALARSIEYDRRRVAPTIAQTVPEIAHDIERCRQVATAVRELLEHDGFQAPARPGHRWARLSQIPNGIAFQPLRGDYSEQTWVALPEGAARIVHEIVEGQLYGSPWKASEFDTENAGDEGYIEVIL